MPTAMALPQQKCAETFQRNCRRTNTPRRAETRALARMRPAPKPALDHREPLISRASVVRAGPENASRRNRLQGQNPSFQNGCRRKLDYQVQVLGRRRPEKNPIYRSDRRRIVGDRETKRRATPPLRFAENFR